MSDAKVEDKPTSIVVTVIAAIVLGLPTLAVVGGLSWRLFKVLAGV